MQQNPIGQRIREERERKKVSQEKLAKAVGWNHHQIVSEVEQGKREVKAWELAEIAKFLSVAIEVLLGERTAPAQPFVLWRERPVHEEKLLEAAFLSQCDHYLWVEELVSGARQTPTAIFENLARKTIDLRTMTFEHAYMLAESVRYSMGLGDFPATQLLDVLESRYGVKFIVQESERPFSAASARSDKGCFILMNARQVEPRQYFSIAHELFHLITWDEAMLKEISANASFHEKNEQLANAFAAGLLIPREKLEIEAGRISFSQEVSASDLMVLAEQFHVSKEAMLYRMLNVGLLTKGESQELKEQLHQIKEVKSSSYGLSARLKAKFVRLVYLACEHVKISRAKAAALLGVDLCDLSDVFNAYGFVEIHG